MKSDVIKKGIERAPHRSLLRAVGCTRAEMDKPFIGVINSFSEIVPGHIHLRDILRQLRQGCGVEGESPLRSILLRCVMALL